jgi:hypothetical protein
MRWDVDCRVGTAHGDPTSAYGAGDCRNCEGVTGLSNMSSPVDER